MQCLPRICGQYRPNRTPGTKSGVGACVRLARQSRDCLRGCPLRAPPLFAAVRSALGSVLPTVARGALSLQFARSADPRLSIAVRYVLRSRMHTAWLGVEYHIRRQSAHLRGALHIPSLERTRISCRASLCFVALVVVNFRFIVAALCAP